MHLSGSLVWAVETPEQTAMTILRSAREMRAIARSFRAADEQIALVPTMGYLHEGHLSLVRKAVSVCKRVVVSIYVNPTQFGENEDLDTYPRGLAKDVERVMDLGADVVFAPDDETIYPAGYATYVTVSNVTDGLCGASRPTHFRGVTTVVSKLFNIVEPDIAIFGEKDYQQLAVIRRMVTDLNFPIEILGMPIIREPDGLAMSSRNVHLSHPQRQAATALNRTLRAVRKLYNQGQRDPVKLVSLAEAMIASEPELTPDYLELIDPDSLAPLNNVATLPESVHMALAVYAGETRLIDNLRISE